MIYWRLKAHMLGQGWGTAYELAKEAGISRPAAMRVLSGAPIERVDVALLDKLAAAFGVTDPLTLLEHRK